MAAFVPPFRRIDPASSQAALGNRFSRYFQGITTDIVGRYRFLADMRL